jgi:hypothetical protein
MQSVMAWKQGIIPVKVSLRVYNAMLPAHYAEWTMTKLSHQYVLSPVWRELQKNVDSFHAFL